MRKICFGLTLLLLTGCGSPAVKENANKNANDLPLYMDFNNNQALPLNLNMNLNPGNTNGNSTVVGNENRNGISNANVNSVTEMEPVNIALAVPHETPFDCKAMSVYTAMPFFESFQRQFEGTNRYSTGDVTAMIEKAGSDADKQAALLTGKTTKENVKNITSACFAQDASMFVAVVEGEAGGYGFKVIRYLPARGVLEIAQREDEQAGGHWSITPGAFGKRTGTSLSLAASGKNGDATEWMDFTYNYVTNFIRLQEYCVRKPGQIKTCMAYPY